MATCSKSVLNWLYLLGSERSHCLSTITPFYSSFTLIWTSSVWLRLGLWSLFKLLRFLLLLLSPLAAAAICSYCLSFIKISGLESLLLLLKMSKSLSLGLWSLLSKWLRWMWNPSLTTCFSGGPTRRSFSSSRPPPSSVTLDLLFSITTFLIQ